MKAPNADIAAKIVAWLSFPPKPPPNLLTLLSIFADGIFSTFPTPC